MRCFVLEALRRRHSLLRVILRCGGLLAVYTGWGPLAVEEDG